MTYTIVNFIVYFEVFYLSFLNNEVQYIVRSVTFLLIYFLFSLFLPSSYLLHIYSELFFIIQVTSEERLTSLINTITRLFFDPKKPEIVSQPSVGGIFIDYLRDLFELRRGLSAEDDLQSLHDISSHLVTLKGRLLGREYVIQRIGYTLLTIYSNDPSNCDILEENYHFLSLLVVSLPALEGWDAISAILTTLNYVCQCIDTETELPILALCAAISVMTRNAIYAETDTEREKFYHQLDATCSSFEAIIRGQAKYAFLIVKYGVLKWILCDPLVDLDQQLESGGDMSLRVYIRVIDFIISVHKSGPPTSEIIRDSGLLEITFRVISANNETNILPIEISRRLLMLLEGLVNADFCHLEEILRFLMRLFDVLLPVPVINSPGISGPGLGLGSCNVKKITFLCQTFSRIIEGSKKGYSAWSQSCGVEYLINMMNRLHGVFTDAPCTELLQLQPINQQLSPFMIKKSSRSLSSGAILSKTSSGSRKNLFSYSQPSSNSNFDISQIDDPFPGQIMIFLDILVAIADCISTDFRIFKMKNKGEKDFEIFFTVYRRNYVLLANSLIGTNIFSSAHAEWGIRILFGLLKGNFRDSIDPKPGVSSKSGGSIILSTTSRGLGILPLTTVSKSNDAVVNPEAIEVIVESLHHLPVIVGVRIIETLQAVAEGSEKGKKQKGENKESDTSPDLKIFRLGPQYKNT